MSKIFQNSLNKGGWEIELAPATDIHHIASYEDNCPCLITLLQEGIVVTRQPLTLHRLPPLLPTTPSLRPRNWPRHGTFGQPSLPPFPRPFHLPPATKKGVGETFRRGKWLLRRVTDVWDFFSLAISARNFFFINSFHINLYYLCYLSFYYYLD